MRTKAVRQGTAPATRSATPGITSYDAAEDRYLWAVTESGAAALRAEAVRMAEAASLVIESGAGTKAWRSPVPSSGCSATVREPPRPPSGDRRP